MSLLIKICPSRLVNIVKTFVRLKPELAAGDQSENCTSGQAVLYNEEK